MARQRETYSVMALQWKSPGFLVRGFPFFAAGMAGQYDLGNPNTRSAIWHMISCALTGAMRGIYDSRR